MDGQKQTTIEPKYCVCWYGHDSNADLWDSINHILHSHILFYCKREKSKSPKKSIGVVQVYCRFHRQRKWLLSRFHSSLRFNVASKKKTRRIYLIKKVWNFILMKNLCGYLWIRTQVSLWIYICTIIITFFFFLRAQNRSRFFRDWLNDCGDCGTAGLVRQNRRLKTSYFADICAILSTATSTIQDVLVATSLTTRMSHHFDPTQLPSMSAQTSPPPGKTFFAFYFYWQFVIFFLSTSYSEGPLVWP